MKYGTMVVGLQSGGLRDRVSLGATLTTLPKAPLLPSAPPPPPAPTLVTDTLTLSEQQLDQPLSRADLQSVLSGVTPGKTPSHYLGHLREQLPGLGQLNGPVSFRVFADQTFRSAELTAKSKEDVGTLTATVYAGQRLENSAKPAQMTTYLSFQAAPDMAVDAPLPDAIQEIWAEGFSSTPGQEAQKLATEFGLQGPTENIWVFAREKGGDHEKRSCDLSASIPGSGGSTLQVRADSNGVRGLQATFPKETVATMENLPPALAEEFKSWGLTPADLQSKSYAGSGLKAGEVAYKVSRAQGKTTLTERTSLVDQDGKDAGLIIRDFHRETKEGQETRHVYHDLVNLEEGYQGSGFSKAFLRNSIGLYETLGVEKVDLTAAISVGGYAWAKYGWQLTPGEMDKGGLAKQISSRAERLQLTPEQKQAVQAILESSDPKKVWALSDLAQPVVGLDGSSTKLGKALLLGTKWKATLPMDDVSSRRRLNAYLDG